MFPVAPPGMEGHPRAGLDGALIAEDDVESMPNALRSLERGRRFGGPDDFVRFPRLERGEAGEEVSGAPARA